MLATEIVQVDPSVLAYALGTICPILTAVLTKSSASAPLKALVNAVLATVAGLLAVSIASKGRIDVVVWIEGVAKALVLAWASYYGFWKPTGVAPGVGSATGKFGIGSSSNN